MYTVSEVANQLRLHPQTIREWLRDGTLKGVRLGGTKAGWRIKSSAVDELLERRRPAQGEAPDADR